MGRGIIDTMPAALTAEFLCRYPNSPAESTPPLRNEEGESVNEPVFGDQTTTMPQISHEHAHGNLNHQGRKVVVDSSLRKAWFHLKATFRPSKTPDQRRHATNARHAGSTDLALISKHRKFIVDLANSKLSMSEAKTLDTALSTEDLAALNKLHSSLIPASHRATRDMSQLIDSSWWSE